MAIEAQLFKWREKEGPGMLAERNRKSNVLGAGVVCAALSLSVRAMSQQPSPQPSLRNVEKLGPHVGNRVPDFTLLDQKGQSRGLTHGDQWSGSIYRTPNHAAASHA